MITIEFSDWKKFSVTSFTIGPQHLGQTGGGVDSRATPHDCFFTRVSDIDSSTFMRHASGGKIFPKVTVVSEENDRCSYKAILGNAAIASFNQTKGVEGTPTESISLDFESLTWEINCPADDGGAGGDDYGY
jgi:type VI protein secretion system component Hcp